MSSRVLEAFIAHNRRVVNIIMTYIPLIKYFMQSSLYHESPQFLNQEYDNQKRDNYFG